jgi:transketolase
MTYEETLKNIALNDERIIVMTAENRALIRNLPTALGDRFIDTGITEQTMIGMAAGLALRGRKPVCHALATFLTMRAFEFIRTDVGISGLPVKLTSWVPGFLSDANGPTHQAIEDVSIMRGIPGMQVFCPADEQDMVAMLPHIWGNESPVYLRAIVRKSTVEHAPFEIGKAEIFKEGSDITLLVYGYLFEEARQCMQILEAKGMNVGLVNMRSLQPVDEEAILRSCKNSGLVVTIEDHFQIGGLYSIVAETLLKHGVSGNVKPIALNQKWFKPALMSEVLEYEGFTPEKLAVRCLGFLN